MKVLLINPPQRELLQPRAYIPLGLAYIGAILEKNNIEVQALQLADTPIKKIDKSTFPHADWYGITCATSTLPATIKISRLLRSKGERVVIGGIHPSILPYETLWKTGACFVITGEGEHVFRNLVTDGCKTQNPVIDGDIIKDLDELPLPARHLFNPSDVIDTTGIHGCEKGIKATTIISSRGCPYNCSFCTKQHKMFRMYRFRSADSIIMELRHLIDEYGIQHVRFVDDIFTLNKRRVIKLCEAIKDLEITWINITRADHVDEEMLKCMKEAGCIETHIGVESGSQRILKLMNKNETSETIIKTSEKIKKAGIKLKVYLMYNFPTETDEDRFQTINLIKKIKPDKFTLSRFIVLVGSDVWANPRKYGATTTKNKWFYPDKDRKWLEFKKSIEEAVK